MKVVKVLFERRVSSLVSCMFVKKKSVVLRSKKEREELRKKRRQPLVLRSQDHLKKINPETPEPPRSPTDNGK